MATLERIFIKTFEGEHSIRIDWDNDRHQSITIKQLDPESVKQGLLDAAGLIELDQRSGHL